MSAFGLSSFFRFVRCVNKQFPFWIMTPAKSEKFSWHSVGLYASYGGEALEQRLAHSCRCLSRFL